MGKVISAHAVVFLSNVFLDESEIVFNQFGDLERCALRAGNVQQR